MSKGYIVYPQGDFDGNAFCIDADSPEEAAYMGWREREWSITCTVCVVPFENEKCFKLVLEPDNDA